MSEIVERVARAIYAAAWGFGHPPPTGVELEEARAQSRAAIEAMRESTHAMQYAGRDCISARATWAAMIDEALK